MKVPTPRACGLPPKFERWRPAQEDALRASLAHQGRILALCAATGFGKSPLLVALALLSGKATAFVTESRSLQDQMLRDFESIGMVDLRGRANYQCEARPDWSCEDGYAGRCQFKGSVNCPSTQAEFRASGSLLVCTNYAKWTSNRRYGRGLEHIEQVMFDEGDRAPDALSAAMQVLLRHKEIETLLGLDFPDPRQALEMVEWLPWARQARAEAESLMMALKHDLHRMTHIKPGKTREYIHLRNLVRRLSVLATAIPQDWVVDEVPGGYQFDPIRPGRYVEGALLCRVPKVIFASATIRPKTLSLCGIPKVDFTLQEYPSEFSPARCPVYYVPTMRVDHRAPSLAPLWVLLDQIAGRRTDRKGLVQTISYARQQEVLAASRFRHSMLVNAKGEAATPVVDAFKSSPPGTILVSPSVGTGFDFPGSACEWQFVCKIPFPDGRSKILQARQADDPEYGAHLAASKLEQISGRLMRSEGDQGETFIGDMHLDWFGRRHSHLFTQSFVKRFKIVETIPAPPPRL